MLSVPDSEPIMLGPPKSRQLNEPILVSLDDLAPTGHFYRHLEHTLDLAFVRDLVRETYADIGRPSVDPVVFFKLQLILFFEGLRSERQLLRVVADRLSLRWYIGYDLTEALPDHSSLTRIRERYGVAVFRRFFETITEKCVTAGLVWGQELFVDSTDVAANASIDSLQPRFAVEAHLARLFEESSNGEDGGDDPGGESRPTHLPVVLTDEERADLADRAATRHDWIGKVGRPDRTRTSGPYRRTADFRASATDPDASPLRPSATGARLGYHDHYVVDGGKARIILTALVTPAEVQDNQPAIDLLWRPRFRWKLPPRLRCRTTNRRSPLADPLPLETPPAPGDRRHEIRHGREHRGDRAGAHPRLRPALGGRPPSRTVSGHGLRLRPGGRQLPLSGKRDLALHFAV